MKIYHIRSNIAPIYSSIPLSGDPLSLRRLVGAGRGLGHVIHHVGDRELGVALVPSLLEHAPAVPRPRAHQRATCGSGGEVSASVCVFVSFCVCFSFIYCYGL